MKRERIDKLIVDRGLAHSRTRAQALVMAGVVLVNEQLVKGRWRSGVPLCQSRGAETGSRAARVSGRCQSIKLPGRGVFNRRVH